ncbi:hypothetical protein F5Y15DRAFT_417327 [Xylariaceae sp. FL0016]|nr:hypothetical protein F5Y15DRAFT_417327 [Xylariaceae sp. FL0016]
MPRSSKASTRTPKKGPNKKVDEWLMNPKNTPTTSSYAGSSVDFQSQPSTGQEDTEQENPEQEDTAQHFTLHHGPGPIGYGDPLLQKQEPRASGQELYYSHPQGVAQYTPGGHSLVTTQHRNERTDVDTKVQYSPVQHTASGPSNSHYSTFGGSSAYTRNPGLGSGGPQTTQQSMGQPDFCNYRRTLAQPAVAGHLQSTEWLDVIQEDTKNQRAKWGQPSVATTSYSRQLVAQTKTTTSTTPCNFQNPYPGYSYIGEESYRSQGFAKNDSPNNNSYGTGASGSYQY